MAQGHGISDAVRKSIKDWMTDRVIDILFKESGSKDRASFTSRLRAGSEWTRISRSMSAKAGVWQRTYYSKLFGGKSSGKTGVGLTILTNKGNASWDRHASRDVGPIRGVNRRLARV